MSFSLYWIYFSLIVRRSISLMKHSWICAWNRECWAMSVKFLAKETMACRFELMKPTILRLLVWCVNHSTASSFECIVDDGWLTINKPKSSVCHCLIGELNKSSRLVLNIWKKFITIYMYCNILISSELEWHPYSSTFFLLNIMTGYVC